ncbi:hypothetical protein OEZ86_013360 [Tetradesmus obliquus]|nr:hypothetical protein OEZ86_013360 [Tetradesmus obliquus]
MSLQQLLAEYGQLVRQLAVALQLHEKGLGGSQEARLQELLLRCLYLMSSVGRAKQTEHRTGRPDMLALCLTSYETGEHIPEPSKERHAAVVAALGLSREQKLRITQGSAVFKQLMTPVLTVSLTVAMLYKLHCWHPAAANVGAQGWHYCTDAWWLRWHVVGVVLGLSREQKLRITQGSAVFKQLMTPVLTELRQLQQQAGSSSRCSSTAVGVGLP